MTQGSRQDRFHETSQIAGALARGRVPLSPGVFVEQATLRPDTALSEPLPPREGTSPEHASRIRREDAQLTKRNGTTVRNASNPPFWGK